MVQKSGEALDMELKKIYNVIFALLAIVSFLGMSTLCLAQNAIDLRFTGVLPAQYEMQLLENKLQYWIQNINSDNAIIEKPFSEAFLTTEVANSFKELKAKTMLKIVSPTIEIQLVQLPNGSIECRRLFCVVEDGEGQQERELVLVINEAYKIIELRFAIGLERYQQIINESESLVDKNRRKIIIAYLEQFRTAYNRKDAGYIKQQFSEDALILVGSRVQKTKNEINRVEYNELGNSEIYRITKLSKDEYINHLTNKIFKLNANLDIEFKDIKILRHEEYPEMYGVNLYQIWRSSTYSDTGYLYLIIDFENENQPLIHVRAWQKNLFEDQSTFDFSFFNIIK